MTYEFIIDGETFTVKTWVNSFRLRVYQPSKQRVIAIFDANSSSLFSRRPTGAWAFIHQEISLDVLEQLQPHLVTACQQDLAQKSLR